MAELAHREVDKRVGQGRSAKRYRGKLTSSECKAKLLVGSYNAMNGEQRDNFIHELCIDGLYILSLNGKLEGRHLKSIYYHYSQTFYKRTRSSFNRYYSYCKIFQKFLSKNEKELLVDKLMRPKHAHMIKIALREITFLKSRREKLYAAYIVYKLNLLN